MPKILRNQPILRLAVARGCTRMNCSFMYWIIPGFPTLGIGFFFQKIILDQLQGKLFPIKKMTKIVLLCKKICVVIHKKNKHVDLRTSYFFVGYKNVCTCYKHYQWKCGQTINLLLTNWVFKNDLRFSNWSKYINPKKTWPWYYVSHVTTMLWPASGN